MIINQIDLLDLHPISDMLATKRQHQESGTSYGLSENGYDIRIKQNILFAPDFYGNMGIEYEDRAFTPGKFVLASSIEFFHMPTTLVGIVHDKSTWARRGLSIFNTVIDSGFGGFLTLELVYHGQTPLHIPAGSGIAHIVFHKVSTPIAYNGKYQMQPDEPVGPR